MAACLQPADETQVRDAVAWAAAEGVALEVIGGGSKQALGRPMAAATVLDLSGLSGITAYEPAELVLTAGAGTPLSDIETALEGEGQALAFEPPDYGPLMGGGRGTQSVGGVLSCNLSGSRRIRAGAARDHFLGVRAVSGRGETFKAGGRVVKNVTGYDICKLLAGSYGTLAVLTELTLKVLPAAEKTRTVLIHGLDDGSGAHAMTAALASAYEVTGAAHLPGPVAALSTLGYVARAGGAVTALRLEGPGPSVEARCTALRRLLADRGPQEELHGTNSRTLWREIRDVSLFPAKAGHALWRISVPPAEAAATAAAALGEREGHHLFDHGGGLIWVALVAEGDGGAGAVRAAAGRAKGHALLVRGPERLRAAVPVFPPLAPALAALTARVKESFDPRRILNPGRMYEGV